ncbi:FAD-binding oxidoreductase [Nitriliruptoraceae bacterium ZYF776]|nr:FAD-binding oxidoreductase [Profundirhabdus halotolerans]
MAQHRSGDEVAGDLTAALRRAGVTQVDTSNRRRAEYASDASLYRVPPAAVVFPRDADEVVAVVVTAGELGVPVTARGAGTSIAGNAVGPGVVVDVRRHLRGLGELDLDAGTVRVEPGVVLDDLQRAVTPAGWRFGPDPSTHDRCTLGGMIGNNACGSRALGYGRTVDNVTELDVVTGAGERVTLGRGPGPRAATEALRVAAAQAPVLREHLDRFSRQVSGYGLHHLLPERGEDVAKALVGSEGTCALTLGARLRLVRRPAATVLVVLGYPDVAAAADATPGLLGLGAVAIEGMDARIPDTVRRRRGAGSVPTLPAGAGWLLVELPGATLDEARAQVPAVVAAADAVDHLVVDDPAHARAIWGIREAGAGLVAHAAATPSHAGFEDAAVPPAQLGAYLRAFEDLLGHHGLAGVPYGHFGDGCLHVRLDFPFHRPDGPEVFRAFLGDAADLVAAHGGSLSGEHGDGRARSELLGRMYPPAVLDAFAAFKHTFDPDGICNPGVLVDPAPLDADLRAVGRSSRTAGLGFRYEADGGDLGAAVHRCTGVGRCVVDTPAPGQVMCPSYLATRDERDSTRGRARVLQEFVDGTLVDRDWAAPEVHDALELCLACKGCASDCPTGTDVGTLKAEVLHQTYRGRRRPWTHYTLGRLPTWARLAARGPRWLRRAVAHPALAPLVRAVAGVDRTRQLPRFADRSFRAELSARGGQDGTVADAGPTALLWLDTFTDHFAPSAARAAVQVLGDAGYRVRVLTDDGCCGLTWIATGQLDQGGRRLRQLTDRLADELAAEPAGTVLVALEPPCAGVLRDDARALLGRGAAVEAVAGAVRTLAEALAARRPAWTPPRLDGVRVVAQPHCHHQAVFGWGADRALLAACGVELHEVGGCCWLAGDFGVRRGYADISRRIAETQLLPAIRAAGDEVVVLADGFSCRTQVADLAPDVPTLHLAELLARRTGDRVPGPGAAGS